jgi:hypothetical protein
LGHAIGRYDAADIMLVSVLVHETHRLSDINDGHVVATVRLYTTAAHWPAFDVLCMSAGSYKREWTARVCMLTNNTCCMPCMHVRKCVCLCQCRGSLSSCTFDCTLRHACDMMCMAGSLIAAAGRQQRQCAIPACMLCVLSVSPIQQLSLFAHDRR